jgi:amino acid transporter
MKSGSSKLNLFDLTMIVISLVIGMGIFRTASDAANESITPAVYFGAWVLGGFIALCGALTYAKSDRVFRSRVVTTKFSRNAITLHCLCN